MTRRRDLVSPVKAISLIKKHLPKGWRYEERRYPETLGIALFEKRLIVTVPVVDLYTLGVFFHECGHAILHYASSMRATEALPHVQEYEAERWAMMALRDEGFRVPRAYLRDAKTNVRRRIAEDEDAGYDIGDSVRRWAGADPFDP